MLISRKKWTDLEKRVADLEREVQGQQSLAPNINITYNGEKISGALEKELRKLVKPSVDRTYYGVASERVRGFERLTDKKFE